MVENIDVTEKIVTTKKFIVDGSDFTKKTIVTSLDSGKEVANSYIDKHWPLVERIVLGGLLSLAEETLRDEKNIKMIFEKTYELLPTGSGL